MISFLIAAALLTLIGLGIIAYPLLRKPVNTDESLSKQRRSLALGALAVIPAAALGLYLSIGEPNVLLDPDVLDAPLQPSAREAVAALPPEERAAMINQMVATLAARLETEQGSTNDWRMLGRSYGALGRFSESAEAWRQVTTREDAAAGDWRDLGLALLEGGQRQDVPPEAQDAFLKVIDSQPIDPTALYFLGLAAQQRGDNGAVRRYWAPLRATVPDDVPLAQILDQGLAEAQDD